MIGEVRSGGSYMSQNDLRLRFGLGNAHKADRVEIRWPDGHSDTIADIAGGGIVTIQYGGKVLSSSPYRSLPIRLRP